MKPRIEHPITALATAALLFSSATAADTMPVAQDAHIDLANPGDNVGSVPNLVVSNVADRKTGERMTFVSYDLVPLPGGANLEQAWLRLWVGKVETAGTVEFYTVDAAWDEETLTSGNAPAFSGPFMSLAVQADDEGHYVMLDVTPEVAAWLDGSAENHGFVIVPGTDDVSVSFDSKENAQTSHASELELVLGTASGGIDSDDIADNSVGTDDIEDGSIGSVDIADDSVMSSDIKDGTIMADDLADGAVGSDQILDESIMSSDIKDGTITGADIADGTIGSADVDTSQLQARVVGTCPAGSSIREISESGGVTCEVDTDTNSGGDITAVHAGNFLVGGGTSGDVTLDIQPKSIDASRIRNDSIGYASVNRDQVQWRVYGTCDAGESIREIKSNGTVTCEVDDVLDGGAFWALGGNAGTSPIPGGADFLGTTDDTPLVLGTNGRAAFRLAYAEQGVVSSRNVIGGDISNEVAGSVIGATIAGGGSTLLVSGYAPRGNVVSRNFGTIGGGDNNSVDMPFGFVGGGQFNDITTAGSGGSSSVIAGGQANDIVDASVSTIAGGTDNLIHTASQAFIGGGVNNAVCDPEVFGDELPSNTTGWGAVIGGGLRNDACGTDSFIAGGSDNLASGIRSMVLGGANNEANGTESLAAGRGAIADHRGAFVWADNSETSEDFFSQRDHQVRFRAVGGVRFDVGDDEGTSSKEHWVEIRTQALNTLGQNPGAFRLIDTSTGAYLTLGGGWVTSSDRNRKTAIMPVEPRDILDKLADMPIHSWRYKVEDASIRHIGPMAQDFQATFGYGGDDKGIMAADADGVALVSIKALYDLVQQLEQRTAQLEAQQHRLETLEAGLKALQARLDSDARSYRVSARLAALDSE